MACVLGTASFDLEPDALCLEDSGDRLLVRHLALDKRADRKGEVVEDTDTPSSNGEPWIVLLKKQREMTPQS
jgi:hypothetical protein